MAAIKVGRLYFLHFLLKRDCLYNQFCTDFKRIKYFFLRKIFLELGDGALEVAISVSHSLAVLKVCKAIGVCVEPLAVHGRVLGNCHLEKGNRVTIEGIK